MSFISDEIKSLKSEEELESLRHKLFMENVRLMTERSQIESEAEELAGIRVDLARERRQLEHEKKQLALEMNQLRDEVNYERKRLKDDEKRLDQKQRLIERSFELLSDDKDNIKRQYEKLEHEKIEYRKRYSLNSSDIYIDGIFFRGVNNISSLKKRYKDLLKIYHPDNAYGDNDILLKINSEYEKLRKRFEKR